MPENVVGQQSMSRAYCFTWNNPTAGDVQYLESLAPSVDYLLFGREVGEEGTSHLQGFVYFKTRKRFNQVRGIFRNNHVETTRNVPASILYCKKDNDYEEYGENPLERNNPGKRCDLENFKDDVKTGAFSFADLREMHSKVFAKYPRFCQDYIADHVPRPILEDHDLRVWQADLRERLKGEPDRRSIVFVVDTVGNQGKSWFARWFAKEHERCQVMQPGKKADMAYALDSNIRVLFLDAPRSKQGEFIHYDFLEQIKDGMVFSTKYESRMKHLNLCHVVVLMNEPPDMTKLSEDRYVIINLT